MTVFTINYVVPTITVVSGSLSETPSSLTAGNLGFSLLTHDTDDINAPGEFGLVAVLAHVEVEPRFVVEGRARTGAPGRVEGDEVIPAVAAPPRARAALLRAAVRARLPVHAHRRRPVERDRARLGTHVHAAALVPALSFVKGRASDLTALIEPAGALPEVEVAGCDI